MFGSSQKYVEQKPLKDANFLSVYVYVYKCMFVWICLHPRAGEADVPKLSQDQMGRVRPKINDAAVVYWLLKV